MELNNEIWQKLSEKAWETREHASIVGKTKVGAAILSMGNNIYTGCNLEHKYRCHDIHAEINAISNMVSKGEKRFIAILVVAERYKFTPCGSCLDWIFEHGEENCIVAYQNSPNGEIFKYLAKDLMPHYPK